MSTCSSSSNRRDNLRTATLRDVLRPLWQPYPLFPRIHHKPFASEEADERQVEFPGELGGEAGGSRDAGHERQAGDQGLLDDFKTAAAAHEQDRFFQRKPLLQQGPSDQFIHGIVSSHIFPQGNQFAAGIEQAGCVEPAGSAEQGLSGSQSVREKAEGIRRNAQIRIGASDAPYPYRIDRGLAAEPATRRHDEIALQQGRPDRDAANEIHPDDVALAPPGDDLPKPCYLFTSLDHAFSQEKPRGQFEVLSRRAHRHADRLGADTNLQRLFADQVVLEPGGLSLLPFGHAGDFHGASRYGYRWGFTPRTGGRTWCARTFLSHSHFSGPRLTPYA